MFVNASTHKYPNRWQVEQEEDDRFFGLEVIMRAICLALDATEEGVAPQLLIHADDVEPLLTPLGLATAMEAAASRIMAATDTDTMT